VTARSQAKSIVERALVAAGAAAWGARRHQAGICVLAYHNIVPDGLRGIGDASLHLPERAFHWQLDHIGRRYDVVPLTDVLAPPARARRPRVAITFDDAYLGALTLGVEALVRRGFPATMFVPPGRLGRRDFWWDALVERPAIGTGSTHGVRDYALADCGGDDARVREWAAREGVPVRSLPDVALTSTEDELDAACQRHDGLSLGSHTWSHPNLTRATDAALRAELGPSLAWLEQRFGRVIPWLAYPYGLSNPRAAGEAQKAGYTAALLVGGGWTAPPVRDRYAIPRVNIPAGLSAPGFVLRVSGAFSPHAPQL
jgi:peptidoglycan/xylan/chitin deacetylase (PgdA/CDA1 family)